MTLPVSVPRWELAAENIAVKIRWLGLVLGYAYVNTTGPFEHQLRINAILALGLAFTLLDTLFSLRGRVFLGRYPLAVSYMEALFIGLLCYDHGGLSSRFYYYYFLSLICCAIRHPATITYITCALHCLSITALYSTLPADQRQPFELVLMVLMLVWVSWASSAMARLLRRVGESVGQLNAALQENQRLLEARIIERTQELQDAQAQVLHQEKMAAFGLLAAGIAHEVGNPLTAVSSIVQLLERRDLDPSVLEKLELAQGQLQRIRGILHELVNFSRPATTECTRFTVAEIIEESLSIAKYYRGAKSRSVTADLPSDLPALFGVRGQLVQVFVNLVLNAVDATDKNGAITLTARAHNGGIIIDVADNGQGIPENQRDRVFQPYFTTKKHGTGLGLFVSRKLLADQGGTMTVEDRPGGGTVFSVRLPAEKTIMRASPSPKMEESPYAVAAFDIGRG
jgi:signal transduction histidine kinase